MAEPGIAPNFPPGPGMSPLPRCCAQHSDWATLTQHLVDAFPEVAVSDVVSEVRRAKDAVDSVSIGTDEALEIGELIVRHQLMMRSGRVAEVARLDPERHTLRK